MDENEHGGGLDFRAISFHHARIDHELRHAWERQSLEKSLAEAFAPMADSPNSGLEVERLGAHNGVEAWRGEPE